MAQEITIDKDLVREGLLTPDMSDSRPMRIAVEGCGHGTLDAIYASVAETCETKNWDGIDLLIICGDFQAVRHHQDLNVTAMPAQYRKLADFHNYYYGEKTAPYLTIFVGGNHEASNHLFELFYGGWVAPNIYYLGAANVINVGDLKIAGMSGIYNYHDYTRPHWERLPYSDGTMRSIYHQRELDTRKLLAYRNQVDIGLSHDWPRGIEWVGNHKRLFKHKPFIAEDAEKNRLGSQAAAQVMDRLRPSYWFSAHLHTKYAAQKTYDTANDKAAVLSTKSQKGTGPHKEKASDEVSGDNPENKAATATLNTATSTNLIPVSRDSPERSPQRKVRPQDATAISAWTSFSENVQQQDREEADENQRQLQARQEERERTGQPATMPYTFEETFKEVKVNDMGNFHERQSVPPENKYIPKLPQFDGCCSSTPSPAESPITSPAKRRRSPTRRGNERIIVRFPQTDGASSPIKSTSPAKISNPDAIDIQLSDSEEENAAPSVKSTTQENALHAPESQVAEPMEGVVATSGLMTHDPFHVPDTEAMAIGIASPPSPPLVVKNVASSIHLTDITGDNGSEIGQSINSFKGSIHDGSSAHTNGEASQKTGTTQDTASVVDHAANELNEEATDEQSKPNSIVEVSDKVRALLASMSTTFAPAEKTDVSTALPFPSETITNKTTKFLALSKAEIGQNFLQLLELPNKPIDPDQPLKLHYDPEFLAITRVFNPDLHLGGTPHDAVPPNLGEKHYRTRIIEEQIWVQQNIVDKNLLLIPENFAITSTGDHDPANTGLDKSMPREVTNPQTITFCKMLDINNPFDITEDARDELMAAGPPVDEFSRANRGGGNRGSHRGSRGGSRGGRGGRGGRGRGRGQY